MNVFVTDKLRASVEAASGGQSTVLYLANGLPACFHVLERFKLEDIDPSLGTGTHPAFIINGQEVPRLFIGQYHRPPSMNNGQMWSWPGGLPAHVSLADNLLDVLGVAACGPGYHLMTNMEWSALALWSKKNATVPRGNNSYGKSLSNPQEHGVCPAAPFDYSITSGSGPATWRHTHTIHGVADLVGNRWDIVFGLRMVDGEIQVCENNDAAAWQNGLLSVKPWRAIDFESGALVNPGTSGTLKVGADAAAGGGETGFISTFTYGTSRLNILANGQWAANNFNAMLPSEDLPPAMKHFALAPTWEGLTGVLKFQNSGVQYPVRGGDRFSSNEASIWTLYMKGNSANGAVRIAKY